MSRDDSLPGTDRPEAAPSGSKPASLTRGSTIMTASRVITIGLTYLLNVFLARSLDAAGFGLFRVIITVLAWFELMVAEGLPVWAVRVIDRDDKGPLLPTSYVIGQLSLAALLTVTLVALSPLLATVFRQPGDALLFQLSAIDIPLFALYALFGSVLLATRSYGALVAEQITYYAAKLIVSVLLVYSGLSVVGAVIGNVSSSVAGLALTLVLIAVLLRGRPLVGSRPQPVSAARRGAVQGFAQQLSGTASGGALAGTVFAAGLLTAQTLVLSAGLWLVKALLPAADAGYYGSASLIAQIPISLSSGLVWSLYAAYAEAHRRDDVERMRHYIGQSLRVLIAAAGLWIAAVVPTSGSLMVLIFGDRYASAGSVLAILALGTGLGVVAVTLGPVLLVEGRGRSVLAVAVGLVAAEVAATFALVARIGASGAAIAAAAVFAVASLIALVAMRARVPRSMLTTSVRFLVPTVLVLAAGLILRPGPGILLIGWYVLLTALYAGLCVLTRALTADDIVAVRNGLK